MNALDMRMLVNIPRKRSILGFTYCTLPPVAINKGLCSKGESKMKSPVGMSVVQQIPAFSKSLDARCGKRSINPAIRDFKPSAEM